MPSSNVSGSGVSLFFKLASHSSEPELRAGMKERATLANWRIAPYNRWAFHHVRELIPSAEIANDPARVVPLPAAPATLFEERFLADTDTDGIVPLHRGKLVFE